MISQSEIGPVQTEGQTKELGNIECGQAESIVMLSLQHHLAAVELGKAGRTGYGYGFILCFFMCSNFSRVISLAAWASILVPRAEPQQRNFLEY